MTYNEPSPNGRLSSHTAIRQRQVFPLISPKHYYIHLEEKVTTIFDKGGKITFYKSYFVHKVFIMYKASFGLSLNINIKQR